MKRKNSGQDFALILQKIKDILPENFICTKMTELEQSPLGFASATTKDLIEIKEELEDFANLLALGAHHATLESNIKQQIQAINEILPSAESHQSTKPRLEGAAEEAEDEEEDKIIDSDLEEDDDEIEDSDDEEEQSHAAAEEAPIAPEVSEDEEDRDSEAGNTQNSNNILPVHQDSASYPIISTPSVEENPPSTQPLGDSLPLAE